MVCWPPIEIWPSMPPGEYRFSSESSSPPLFWSKRPRSRPSTATLTLWVSSLVGTGTVHLLRGQGPVERGFDDHDVDPLGGGAGLEADDGVHLAGGDRLRRVHRTAGVDVERLLRRGAVQRAEAVVLEQHPLQCRVEL